MLSVKTVFVSVLLALSSTVPASALWPLPQELSTGSTALRLANNFQISLDDVRSPPKDLRDAASRTRDYLRNDKLQILVPDRGASNENTIKKAKTIKTLNLRLTSGERKPKSIAEEAVAPLGTRDEAYTLTIPDNGSSATLSSNSTLGLFRGLTTFSQLWYEWDGNTYTLEAPISISDRPAYPYRGLMLDTSRNFFPVDDIKRTLDAMSWVKINQFHWHIVDAQSFPFVIPGFERISRAGAYAPSWIYSPKDIKEIIEYANSRGIDIIPEIDTPGHTAIIHNAYPEHIACNNASPWTTYAYQPPSGQLRIASPATTNFTADLLTSAAKMFPGNYFSTGGDEINQNCYRDDPQTQEELQRQGKNIEQALDTFTQVTHNALHDIGKTTVVWQEMALDHEVVLRNDTLIMVWISSEDAAAVADKGFRIVHAASNYFYLDCGGGGWVGQNPEGNSWCDPFKTWQKAYSFDPNAGLTEEQSSLVMGGQQLLWSEQSSPYNMDSIIWPRAASSAEVFWSGPGGDAGAALARLHDVAFRFNRRGVRAIALQPLWCALRPNACDLNA
ncbi:hypothetical protein AX16_006179 [Volvariella volvacea WC 439]|nr:hypothetical protein AX16_006179 [Volvariella volvacea WC 439]